MAGYKRKAKPKSKPVYKKRAPIRRSRPISSGTSLLVNAYFEAHKALDSNSESDIAYSICIDPKVGGIIAGTGVSFKDGGDGNGATIADGSNLSFTKYNTFATLFNEYRVNSATIKVRTDASCGLENAVICSQDKGDSTVVGNMAKAMTGAHKSYSMTTSRRELTYGCKNVGQDLDFRSTNDNTTLVEGAKKYLKVFQKIPAGTGNCEHQIQVMLSLTLKDSKNLN